jgi:hypothetical protein
MEIQTAFATIIGIIMMVAIVVATVVIMGGLANIAVEECSPVEYKALTTFSGKECGFDSTNNQAYCDKTFNPINVNYNYDKCIDLSKNLCCPTSKLGNGWRVNFINNRCCNITRVGCNFCPKCEGYKVNQWKQDNCVDPGVDCGYVCGDQFTPNECGAGVCPSSMYWSSTECTCLSSGERRDIH